MPNYDLYPSVSFSNCIWSNVLYSAVDQGSIWKTRVLGPIRTSQIPSNFRGPLLSTNMNVGCPQETVSAQEMRAPDDPESEKVEKVRAFAVPKFVKMSNINESKAQHRCQF